MRMPDVVPWNPSPLTVEASDLWRGLYWLVHPSWGGFGTPSAPTDLFTGTLAETNVGQPALPDTHIDKRFGMFHMARLGNVTASAWTHPPQMPFTEEYTVAALVEIVDQCDTSSPIAGSMSTIANQIFAIYANNLESPQFRAGSLTLTFGINYRTQRNGFYWMVGRARRDSSNFVTALFNSYDSAGRLVDTLSSSGTFNPWGPTGGAFALGQSGFTFGAQDEATADVGMAAFWTRYLSDDEVLRLVVDPNAMVRRRRVRPAVPAVTTSTLYPVSDAATNGWDTAPTPGGNLYANIDEIVVDDADYIHS